MAARRRSGDTTVTPLAAALHSARTRAGLLQVPVAEALGMSQARLSRIETARAIPTQADMTALLDLYAVHGPQRVELEAMAEAARGGVKDQRLVVQRGRTAAMQARWLRMQHEAGLVRAYHPAVILGSLQTAGYAGAVFGQDMAGLESRIAQADSLVRRVSQRHVLIQTEGALRCTVGSAEVMAGQIEHLIEISRLEHVRLGVIPAHRPMPLVCVAGFHLYEGEKFSYAVVGLEVAAATLDDPDDIAHFASLFSRLTAAAAFGDDARAELERIAEDYRALG